MFCWSFQCFFETMFVVVNIKSNYVQLSCKCLVSFHKKYFFLQLPELNTSWNRSTDFRKYSKMKFHANSFKVSWTVTFVWKYGGIYFNKWCVEMQTKLKRIITQTEQKSEIYNRKCAIRIQEFFFLQLLNSVFSFFIPCMLVTLIIIF